MHKDYTSNISPLGSKIFNISKVVFISALIFSLGGFFIAGTALATHTASVTVSPQYVKGGSTDTYTFTVTNNGDDKLQGIVIKFPDNDTITYNSNLQCPLNWIATYDSTSKSAKCLYDFTNPQYIEKGGSAQVSFDATSASALSYDAVVTWTITTYDNAGGFSTNQDAQTTVDVTPPTTKISELPADWTNEDVSVTLTCDDGIGIGCKEIHYTINGENEEVVSGDTATFSVSCESGSVCEKTITYYSVDKFDQSGTQQTSASIKIDKKAPETTATVGTPKYETDTTTYIISDTQITLSAEDEGSEVQTIYYKVDDGEDQTYSEPFTLSEASEGQHIISYWSIDNVGNAENANALSVYIDNSGPTIGDIVITPSHESDGTLYISGTSNISAPVNDEDGSGVESCEYALNANDANPTWNPATYDPQKNLCKAENVDTSGATSINFRAIDNLENSNEGNAVAVSPDTAGPTISNPSIDPSSPSNDNTPTITFGISDDKSGVKSESVQISDGSNTYTPTCSDGSCSYTFTSALDDGSYTFTISASDNVGNSASAKIENYVIDTVKPDTTDDAPTGWQNSDVTITLTPSDPEPSSGLEWTKYCTDTNNTCDPASGIDYDPDSKPQISAQGITYFRYASKDKAGNIQDTVSREIKIDKTPPTVSVSGWNLGDSWTKETQTASVSCQDGVSGCDENSYKLYISTNEITECSANPDDYTLTSPQSITQHSWVCAYAEDNAGNPGFSSSPVEFKVDQTSPTGELTGVPENWQNTDAKISLTYDDKGGSGVDNAYLDVVAYDQTCTPSTSYSGGTITVFQHSTACWKVVDNAGNEATGSSEIKVDKIKPNTTINSPDSGSWQKEDFKVSISDSDEGDSGLDKCYYQVKSNDVITKDWTERTCSSPITLTVGPGQDCRDQGDKKCRILVKATDVAGSTGTTKWREFSIDWTAPQTTLTVSPGEPATGWYNSNTGAPTITLSCDDSNRDITVSGCDKIYYKWDTDDDYTEVQLSDDVTEATTKAPEGTHTLFYFSKDKAGNSKATQTKQFKVDTQAPTVTVNSLITNNNTPQLSGTVDDATATVEVAVAGKTYQATVSTTANDDGTYNWTADVTNTLNDGIYDVAVSATDQAGNVGNDNTSNELTVDTQKPTIANFIAPEANKVYKGDVPLKFTPSDTGTAVTCSYKIDDNNPVSINCQSGVPVNTTISDLSDGRHSLEVTVTDAAGNSVSSDSVSFVVDLDNTLTVGSNGFDFTTIQSAVNAAMSGDTIQIAAGTYDEQVVIDKSLTIQGQGDATIIKPSQATSNNFQLFSRKAGGSANTAAIVVANADATIKNLKIDGSQISSVPSGATMFVGILYRGVNGTIDSVTVEEINIVNGNAIYLSSMGNEVEVEVKGCTISNFYKNGITSNYEGLTVNIHNNNITGSGLLNGVAQNGIQVGFGATGSVEENTISDVAYTGEDYEATGVLFIDSSGTAKDNIVTNCQAGIVVQAGWYPPVTCDVTIENNTIDASGLTGLSYIAGTGAVTWDENAIINVTIKNNSLTGPGYGEGISIGSEYGEGIVNATIEGNDISNWGDGIWLGPTSNQIGITHNKIEGNATYGVYNGGTGMLDATNNWWGDVSGPYNESTNIGGKGDTVNDNVDYRPWCAEESCSVEDNVAPYVVSHIPSTNAVGVNPLSDITVTFSEDVQCNAENGNWADCITLSPGVDNGSVSYNSDTYTLTFTPPEGGLDSNQNYTVIISDVEDKSGNLLDGSVSWQFTTANHYSISIYTGWNLISIPTVPVDTSVEAVLGDAASAIDSVWTYDAASDTWYVAHPNNPEAPGNLTNMTAGYGYWVSAVDDAVISGYGNLFSEQQTPPQRTLVAGWNLIGYYQKAGIYSFGVNYALSTLADDYCDPKTKYWTSLVGYNNEGKNFVNVNWNDEMNPGAGYWIFMKSSSIGTYMYGPGESEESCGK